MSLREFLAAPKNTRTREHMFFNRLYYDLKVASARRGNPLSIFQPDVDRDGYDVVINDGDYERRFQLKSYLRDAATSSWKIGKGLLRPDPAYSEWLNLNLPLCGYGGGVVLIEIDASSSEPSVEYLFTDYLVILGFSIRMWLEASSPAPRRGKLAQLRAELARGFLHDIWLGDRQDKIVVPRKCFLRAKSTDALLAMIGMHNTTGCHLPGDGVAQTFSKGFEAGSTGAPRAGLDVVTIGIAHAHARAFLELANEPELRVFTSGLAIDTP
ncbi:MULTISPECIES: hypothetical protein [Hyphomonas]|nr:MULTISPECIES: hypothetical protein [Hyphomonas]